MTSFTYIQTNFTAGEVSPEMYGRPDVDRYSNALREALNAIILPQGPLTRRPGSRFAAEVKDSTKKTRIVKFVFNTSQAYIIEFGDQYIRFYTNEAQLESGGSPYEISSTYLEAELFELKFTQSADILYIFHRSHKIAKLSRVAATNWTLTDLDFIDGPFGDTNSVAVKVFTTSAAGDIGTAVTVTASGSGNTPFVSTDVGRLIRHKRVGKWRSIKITSYTSSTVVGGVFQEDNPTGYTAGASADWRLGDWSATDGWPIAGSFYQARFIAIRDQNVFGSKSGDFEKFSPTDVDGVVQADSGFNYPIGSAEANNIVWISPGKVIALGTIGGEWTLKAGGASGNEALTPTNVTVVQETFYGSDEFLSVQRPGENVVIFVNRTTRRLHEFVYDYGSDSYQAPELTLLSRHITRSGIVDTAFADGIEWCALTNGQLVSLTYLKEQKVVGFTKHIIGGSLTGSDQPLVESVAVIPSSDLSYQQLWMVVKRTIDGQTVRYVEYLENLFEPEDSDDKDGAYYVDCGLTYSGAATNTLTGLDHLEGEEVAVFADGAVRPNQTVVSGSITLGSTNETKASVAQVGLPNTFRMATLDPEGGNPNGTSQGKTKRCNIANVRFINTLGATIGPNVDSLDEINFRSSDDPMDASPPLHTGFKKIEFDGDYVDELSVVIESTDPTPITVGGLILDITVHEQ